MEPVTHSAGLDLGQAQDFSALAVLGHEAHAGPTAYAVRHLQRWPPGTAYLRIAADVGRLLEIPELAGCPLVVDQTGVGRAVVELFRGAAPEVRRVVLTTGQAVAYGEDGASHVPKKELVSVLQVLLQGRRLRVAADLALAEVLVRELTTFRVKVTLAGGEPLAAWREREQDDLVLAVALAAWEGERAPPSEPGEPLALGSRRAGLFGHWF